MAIERRYEKPIIPMTEDELLLAAELEDTLRYAGYACGGPVATLSEALRLIQARHFDAAIFDIQLHHGETIYPAAQLAASRGIPFLFLTAYGHHHLDRRFTGRPVLYKPISPAELMLSVESLIYPASARANPRGPRAASVPCPALAP